MDTIFQLTCAALTHPGMKRPNNEDFVLFYEPKAREELVNSGCLYIVADGVGGAAQGEKASQYAAEKVLYEYYQHPELLPETRLEAAIFKANRDIHDFVQKTDPASRMSTTLVAAAIYQDKLTMANVGDCRAYLIHAGHPLQITRDHNLGTEMGSGSVSANQAGIPLKPSNQLTRSIGASKDVEVDLFPEIQLQPGDKVLLCSDGLTRYLHDDDLVHLVGQDAPRLGVERLVDFANRKGGVDNISAVLIAVGNITSGTQNVPIHRKVEGKPESTLGQRPIPSRTSARQSRRPKRSLKILEFIKNLPLPKVGFFTRIPQKFAPLLYAGVLLLCLAAALGVFLLTQPAQQSALPPLSKGVTLTPAGTLSLEQSLPLKPTPTRTRIPTATPEPPWVCLMHPIQSGLMALLINAGLSYDAKATYYYYLDCKSTGTVMNCGERKELPPDQHDFIKSSWMIEMAMKNKDDCTRGEGVIYYLPKP